MNRALRFRKRLSVTGGAVVTILLFAFYFAFRSAAQAQDLDRWVAHTQEVLGLIARVQFERSRLTNQIWSFRLTHNPDLPGRFQAGIRELQDGLKRLRILTTDNPAEQKLMDELSPMLEAQMTSLKEAMRQSISAAAILPNTQLNMTLPAPPSERARLIFDAMEVNERALLFKRSTELEASIKRTQIVLFVTGVLAFAILFVSGHIIQREIMKRALIEAGMRKAQELLGGQFEEKRAELGHAMDDLHSQILARQSAEAAMRRLNDELEDRVHQRTHDLEETNRELEAFTYSVSHDLRAPLRHMEGFSRILQQEYGPELPEEAGHYLGRIRDAAMKMSALVEDLLHLSRIGRQVLRCERVSLGAVVEDARAEVLFEAGERRIEWKIGRLPDVEADPVLLRQVLVNLLSNAAKFSSKQSEAVIEIGSREEDLETIVFVRDNGAGFDSRYSDKLFGVFQRLHRQDEFTGTGIGLASVQRIIHKHGGRVWAESQPGKGATFYFSLPAHAREKKPIEELVGARA